MMVMPDNMKQQYYSIKIGKVYRITAEPKDKPKDFPGIGAIGICKWTSSQNGACLQIGKQLTVVPFDCIVENDGISDDQLTAIIIADPKSTYKLLKGLWRMTKHKIIRDLMERGDFPKDKIEVPASYKSAEEYQQQWIQAEEAQAAGAFASEVIS